MILLSLILTVFFSQSFTLQASDFGFSSLKKKDFRKLNEDFATNKKHTTVTSASLIPEGKKFELGIITGESQSPAIGKLTDSFGTDSDVNTIPYAGLMGVMALPRNLNLELIVLPPISASGFTISNISGAVKWSPKDYLTLPVNTAVRLHAGYVTTKWEQELSGTAIDVTSTQYIYGVDAMVSKKFLMLEPFLSLGMLQTNGTMKNTGPVSIFDSSFSSSKEESVSTLGFAYAIGTEFDAWLFKLGVEYGEVYKSNYIKGRVSAQF